MILGTFAMPRTLASVDDTVLAVTAGAANVLSHDGRLRLEICVAEALTNQIIHGAAEGPGPIRDIELKQIPGGVSVSIFERPDSAPFDITQSHVALDDIPLLAENGRGVALILSCADGIRYEPCGPVQKLTLEFMERQDNEKQH